MDEFFYSRRGLLAAGGLGAAAGAGLTRQSAPAAVAVEGPRVASVAQAVSVTDFMTAAQVASSRSGSMVDCTEAFERAQQTSQNIWIPPGRYGLADLRLKNGVSLLGAGPEAVRIDQVAADRPCIDCVSDAETGQLAGINFAGASLHGHPRASVAVLRVAAGGAFAVWRSAFDYFAKDCFRALEIEGHDAANVFRCTFNVTAVGTRDIGVLITGGVYNDLNLFVSQCDSWAVDDSSTSSSIRAIAENCMIFRGQNNQIWATLEEIPRGPANDVGIEDRGHGNLYFTPTVILTTTAKLAYAFRPFSHTTFLNPQIIGEPKAIGQPFAPNIDAPFTVIGGRNGTHRGIGTAFDGHNAERNASLVNLVGNRAEFGSN